MDPSALAPGPRDGGSRDGGSVPGRGPAGGALPPLPDWVLWLQAGLTALVAVLFVALLVQTRQQGGRIQELQERLQGLENSRALERTTGLEQQLRATVERLQSLERDSARLDLLQAETDALSERLTQIDAAPAGGGMAPGASAAEPPPAAPGAREGSPAAGASGGGEPSGAASIPGSP